MLKKLFFAAALLTTVSASAVDIITPGMQNYPFSIQVTPEYETEIMYTDHLMYEVNGAEKKVISPWFKKSVTINNATDEQITLNSLEFTVSSDDGTFQSTDMIALTETVDINYYKTSDYYFSLTDLPRPFVGNAQLTISGVGMTTGTTYINRIAIPIKLEETVN
jgi:hypothetical protein